VYGPCRLAVEAPKPPRPWSVDVPVAGAVGGDQPPATATDSLIAVQDNSLLSSSSGLPVSTRRPPSDDTGAVLRERPRLCRVTLTHAHPALAEKQDADPRGALAECAAAGDFAGTICGAERLGSCAQAVRARFLLHRVAADERRRVSLHWCVRHPLLYRLHLNSSCLKSTGVVVHRVSVMRGAGKAFDDDAWFDGATAAVSDDSDAATVAAIPPKVMLEQCLRRPIERRAVRVGERLMNRLRGGWGLPRELQMLRDIFMGGSADALALFRCGPISSRFPLARQFFDDDAGVGLQRCTH
jgi:hypothetical protein